MIPEPHLPATLPEVLVWLSDKQIANDLLRFFVRSQALFSLKTQGLCSLRHLAHGGAAEMPSGPVGKSHLAFRWRQGKQAL